MAFDQQKVPLLDLEAAAAADKAAASESSAAASESSSAAAAAAASAAVAWINSRLIGNILLCCALLGLGAVLLASCTSEPVVVLSSSSVPGEEPRLVEASNGVVASDDKRCSIIGSSMLIRGGHAIDAAVATALCEGVVNPMASGIGGGAFLLVRLSNGTTIAYDMREVAPGASSENMYQSNPAFQEMGALSIGVPGELAGLHLAWKNHGRLPWKDLVEPAIALARDGFVASSYLVMEMNKTLSNILSHEALRRMLSPNGTLARAGDTLHNKQLARTLQEISIKGPAAFYSGEIAEKMVRDVQEAGGILTLNDLKNYKVVIREPTVADAMGFTILGMPPPSSGGAAVTLVLNILSNFKDISSVPEGLYTHRLVEAFKHAYAARMKLADPAFVDVSRVMTEMLSTELAAKLHKMILDNTTFPPEYYGSMWNQLEDHGTSHFGIVDPDRNAVSMTTTVNWAFGSKILSASTGILMNNEMDDFSTPSAAGSAPPNFIRPNKRPLSSMSPVIVLKDGELRGVVGASGGTKIISGTVQVFLNHFIRGMDPLTAVSKARIHHQLIPNEVDCEDWTLVTGELVEVSQHIRAALSARGHKVVETNGYCVTQLVLQNITQSLTGNGSRGELIGVSDYRKNGAPAGF